MVQGYSLLLLITASLIAQMPNPAGKAPLSSDTVSSDSVAIYRDVLKNYVAGDEEHRFTLNLSRYTRPFPEFIGGVDEPCIADLKVTKESGVLYHDLKNAGLLAAGVQMVEPNIQKVQDPSAAIRQGVDVEKAVGAGFRSALFTLSEVVYSHDKNLAAVRYSFRCGTLCGNGETLLYKLTSTGWSRLKRSCGSWIS